jgi:septal ring factor EnvC (AmiA/AmiB activator)
MLVALIAAAALVQQAPDPDEIEALEDEATQMSEAARARELEAEAVRAEIAQLQRRLVDAGDRVRVREAEADAALARLEALEAEERVLLDRLSTEQAGLARVLAALQRIELADPPALAVNPDDATEAARAAGLLARIAPELERRAASVRARLSELDALRERLSGQAEAVGDARERLAGTREQVEVLIEERQALEARLRAESSDFSARARAIANEAGSLRELLAEIRRYSTVAPRRAPRPTRPSDLDTSPVPRLRPERLPPGVLVSARPLTAPLETLRFADMRGRVTPPARGELRIGFGARGPDGSQREGVWFQTGARAQVSAPFDGEVVFTGAFGGLENVIMITTPDDYTLILGGMALSYVSDRQSLLAGEPVGVMPDRANPAPMLYFGIMRGTNAVDPEDWLRPEFRRGQG